MTNTVTGAMDSPPGSRDYEDPREKREMIKINQRAILQFFNIRVIVNPERIEIKGTIPTQILDKINKEGKETAPIITSPFEKGGNRGISIPKGE